MIAPLLFGTLLVTRFESIVLVTNDPLNVPRELFSAATIEKIEQGEADIRIGDQHYEVFDGRATTLIIDDRVLSVRQLRQLTSLAEAVAGAPRTGKVASLGKEALAVLEEKLPENLPNNFWRGDKLPADLRYEIRVRVDLTLATESKSIRYPASPQGESDGLDSGAFLATYLEYKGLEKNARGLVVLEYLSASFLAIKTLEGNPGAFARLTKEAASDFADYMTEREGKYADALNRAMAPYLDMMDSVSPGGRSSRKVSDLDESVAFAIKSSLLQQHVARGFEDETDVERFLALAEVTIKRSISLVVPYKTESGQVIRFGYNLAMPKGK